MPSVEQRLKYWCERAETAEAELAQIKAQKPVDGFVMADGVAHTHKEYGEGLFFSDEALRPIYVGIAPNDTPKDVINLVIAARDVAYCGHINVVGKEFDVLDKALEAFAERIDWNDQPEDAALYAAPVSDSLKADQDND